MKRKMSRRGFTIVELVIVIAVIGILATVLVPTFGDVINNAKGSAAKQEAKNAYTSYLIANNGTAADVMVYKHSNGKIVALENGVPVNVYETEAEFFAAYQIAEFAMTAGTLYTTTGEAGNSGSNGENNSGNSGEDPNQKEKAERPDGGKEVFDYTVSEALGTDDASIFLPESYTKDGTPTKLVIMNRGAGGGRTSSEGYTLNTELLKNGYATLHVQGIPSARQNTKYIQGNYGAPYGSPAFIESVVAAYRYVTEKYNIATDGCAVFGVSCGGLQSLNLVNAKVLPIKVAVVDAPVVDLHNDCYFGGDWVKGTLQGGTAAGIAWMYQFDHCDFEVGTYTIDGTIYEFAKKDQTSLEALWQLNKHKVEPYDPYTAGAYTDAGNNLAISFPCPVKMWFGLDETTNSVTVGQEFIQRCQNGGTVAEFRGVDTSTHGIHAVSAVYRTEMIAWISRYLQPEKQPDPVPESVLNANNNVFLKDDGTVFHSDGEYKKVSDYIEIPEGCIISKFGSITNKTDVNAYCVFYDKNKNVISAYKPQTSDKIITGQWRYTETPPEIPEGAKYIRIAFNNGLDNQNGDHPIKYRDYALLEFTYIGG